MMAVAAKIPLVLKLDDWPPEDQQAWSGLFVDGTFFGESGPCRHWAEGTRRLRRQAYGQWLSFIVRSRPEFLQCEPAARITQEHVEAFIDESTIRLRLRSVSNLVTSLASLGQAMDPQRDWSWLWRAGIRLYRQSDPYALKPPIPLSASDIYHWALGRLAHVASDPAPDELARAAQYRQTLMVGLLITRPVRARAFVHMRLGRHLESQPNGYRLRFYPEDMKDRRAHAWPVPNELCAHLTRYLSVYRPVLLRQNESDRLWISMRGNPISQDTFTKNLANFTSRHFGLELRPHAFRHIAATSIAEVTPQHVGIISDILGHATLRTAELHYNRARAIEASNSMQSLMREIRRDSRTLKRNKRREKRHAGAGDDSS